MESLHPIESFMRQYLPEAGGAWDRVEPQVYDLLLPRTLGEAEELLRVTFDPEALPEHAGSRFMTLATPLVDRLLADARQRGRYARGYVNGLNLHPFGLEKRLRQALDLPDKATLELSEPMPADTAVAVYWFEATFVSDQKEQAMFRAAVDLHQLRNVRHLERLLDETLLDERPAQQLESAGGSSLTAGYQLARDQVTATVSATGNRRRRELEDRTARQQRRMGRYYRDLLDEADARIARATEKHQDPVKELNRRRNIERERDVRLAEVRRKATLRIELRLSNLLEVHHPKLLVPARLTIPTRVEPIALMLTWDLLLESLEPLNCPRCLRPVFALRLPPRDAGWCCPSCTASVSRK